MTRAMLAPNNGRSTLIEKQPPKILLVTTLMEYGGVQNGLLEFVRGLGE